MDEVAKEQGEISDNTKKTTDTRDKKQNNFKLSAKTISDNQSKLAKKKAELDAKKREIETG